LRSNDTERVGVADPKAGAQAEKIIRNQKIGLVNALTTGAARHLLAACQRTNTPLIITVLTRTSLSRCKAAANYAHAIVALNRETLKHLKENHRQFADKLYLSSKPLLLPTLTPTYALALIEAWPRLVSSVGNLKLVIIGNGRLLYQARRKAAQVNRQLQSRCIQVPGAVLDPEPILANTDILLGAGYTALQGLAWGCAVIAIGYAGLFGLLTPENIEEAIAANFGDTAAHWPQVDSQLLAEQILAAHQQLAKPRDWTKPVLDQHFNPARIAEDLEGLFAEAIHSKQAQANSPSISSCS